MTAPTVSCLVNGNKGKIGAARLNQIITESEEIDTRLNSLLLDYEKPPKSNQSKGDITNRDEACVEYGRILSQSAWILSHETLLGIRKVLDADLSKVRDMGVEGFDQVSFNEQITSEEIKQLSLRVEALTNWLEGI